jgi:hypothetical protein
LGRRRLSDGDLLEVGRNHARLPRPLHPKALSTAVGGELRPSPELSPAQRRVLVALCRPYRPGDQFAKPPSNHQIAEELHLSVPAVKTHLRTLFHRFGIPDLAHNDKRAALVRAAFNSRRGVASRPRRRHKDGAQAPPIHLNGNRAREHGCLSGRFGYCVKASGISPGTSMAAAGVELPNDQATSSRPGTIRHPPPAGPTSFETTTMRNRETAKVARTCPIENPHRAELRAARRGGFSGRVPRRKQATPSAAT